MSPLTTQQAPLKFLEETWAGLLQNQGPRISGVVEIIPGCAVTVACPSCPDNSPEPPGPGRVIRNMFGWSQVEKTAGSGVWLFRGAPKREEFFLPFWGSWSPGKGGIVPHSVVGSLVLPLVLVRTRMGMAPLSGHTLESGAGHC